MHTIERLFYITKQSNRVLFVLIVFCAFVFVSIHQSFGQKRTDNSDKIYQLSGLILHDSSSTPIPFVKITINRNLRFGISNKDGFFSVPITTTDTIYFDCIGYKPTSLSVEEYLKVYEGDLNTPYIYIIIKMEEDVYSLPEIPIYPYQNAIDIKMAILNMSSTRKEPLGNLYNNISQELMMYLAGNLENDSREKLIIAQQRYAALANQNNFKTSFNFVDPVAIYNLINHINKKSKEKKDKVLHSFPDN